MSNSRWMTYVELAQHLGITPDAAMRWADRMQCPKAFKSRGELVLVAL
jgi:hypothetical protein